MFCDNCKIRNASFVYKDNINGNNIQYNLCEECAKKLNKSITFLDMFKDFFIDFENINSENNLLVCDKCGNNLENIKTTGKVGCENCYSIFKEDILHIIKNIQFDNKHIGKNIQNTNNIYQNFDDEKIDKSKKILELKQKLKKAVEIEDYELAITLRDEIKSIEREG